LLIGLEALRGSSILAEGVNAYVEFLWDSERCPVFADPHKNGRAAAAFLKLLYKWIFMTKKSAMDR